MWSATTRTTPTWSLPRTRERRPSRTSRTGWPRSTASGSATRSPRAARSATTTRRWASPPAAPGSRSSGTSARWATTASGRTSPSSASATCPATSSATGCCCREHIRLVAAFDHRHIFLDPNPDAATSYAERRRLFDLPRSSWADYDAALISPGRRRLSPDGQGDRDLRRRCARRSASRPTVASMTPAELMQRDPQGAGRPVLERRHRHLREGRVGVARRCRRQGQRRDPDQRRGPAREGGRRGRQPGPDPARPDRVRRGRRPDQHRLHRQRRPAWTPPTTR